MIEVAFTERDIKRIRAGGLTIEKVKAQLALFERGSSPVKLHRPCTAGDGINVLSSDEKEECVGIYEEAVREGRVMKFVPASGAASRMFQDWILCLQENRFSTEGEENRFRTEIRKYAFFADLERVLQRDGLDFDILEAEKRYAEIFDYILTPRGLACASLPKALLMFHSYEGRCRTALEEHLVEAALYVRDGKGICRIHFTVSEEHEHLVKDFLEKRKGIYEEELGVTFRIEISTQRSSTNTIAADRKNHPFRDRGGDLVFRPAGHGALLENLNETDGDIVMIKNIDNVVPDHLKGETVFHKKVLGGYLIKLQSECHKYLERLAGGTWRGDTLSEAALFCKDKFSVGFPDDFVAMPDEKKKEFLFERLNRPIRVCGMVKNEGEPGGGPFWVDESGVQTLQIVEGAQVDLSSEKQKNIWMASTHFNPVDIACGLRDHLSRSYDLKAFVDEDTFIISEKSHEGREMKALELPGLWNGAMARWNTVFIEVPLGTFNPVKTVHDLLRPQHSAEH